MGKATIKVCFAELRTTGHYSNMRAEASIETESQDPEKDFPALWERVRGEVRGQLDAEEEQRREERARVLRGFMRQDREGPGPDDYEDGNDDEVGDEDEDEDLPF